MKQVRKYIQKLHRVNRLRSALAGTLCLILAVLIMVSAFSGEDVWAAGSTKLENGPGAVNTSFWYGKAVPKNLEFWQELQVTANKPLNGSGTSVKYDADAVRAPGDTKHDTDVTVTGIDDLNFKLNSIESIGKIYSDSFFTVVAGEDEGSETRVPLTSTYFDENGEDIWYSSGVCYEDAVGSVWNYSYFRYFTRNQTTYYRVVYEGDQSISNLGQELFTYYQNYVNARLTSGKNYAEINGYKIDRYTMANERDYNQAIREVITSFANEKGLKTYYAGTNIPLTKDGKFVERIEMITFNPADVYFGSTRVGSSSYNSSDVDVFLLTTHNYNIRYNPEPEFLKEPTVTTESGAGVSGTLSKDDTIILTADGNESVGELQYYLSSSRLSTSAQKNISWSAYTEPFVADGKAYLYVRHYAGDDSISYLSSDITEKPLSTSSMQTAYAAVTADPVSGSGMDVGTSVTLASSSTAGKLLYVVDGDERLSLEKAVLDADTKKELNALAGSGIALVKLNDQAYVRLNNLWYLCSSPDVQFYEQGSTEIVMGNALRENNSSTIYVLYIETGKDPGNGQFIRYSYEMSDTTEAPTASITTSDDDPTEIKMGSSISLGSSTQNSRIFYTTNGSAPVITVDSASADLVGASGTKEYISGSPIIVNSEFADYGKNLTIMAQAVTYEKSSDGTAIYRVNKDSSVAKFTYSISNQAAVEKVTSVPATTSDAPAEVQVGNKIQLFSDTEGVTIYYTIDGSEPVFDETTGEVGENTYQYSGMSGIVVPEAGESTMLTITAVAYKEGLSASELSRLIFQYPSAVSTPYAAPASGVVSENTPVTLNTATEDARIYYEIAYGDEVPKDPTESSSMYDESSSFKITKKTTIKAYAVKDGMSSAVMTFTYTVSEKLSAPEASLDTGAIVSSGTVITLDADDGATIHYTLDGSDPKDSTNKKVQVGNTAVISGDAGALVMLRAYATKNGFSESDTSTYSYSISSYTGGIYADKENGSTVKNGEVIRLNTDMSDADIYYTTDGTTPTEDSTPGSTVTIHGEPGEKITIMAIALADGTEKTTSFATFTYTIMDKLSAPTASVPNGAVFTRESVVALTAETGRIYYTTDGTEPSAGSSLYRNGIEIDKAVTIKAIAVEDDYQQSDVSTFTYGFASQVETPVASYASGELEMGMQVTFTSATEGASIYYRTDGTEPDDSEQSILYTGPITVNKAANFKVIAVKEHMQDSKILSVGYTVREPVVVEVQEEEQEQVEVSTGNRLQSRRSFSDSESGPSYTDVVLRNATYGAVISAEEGILPDDVQLKVEQTQVTETSQRMVKQMISDTYGVVSSYNVTLLVNGEEVQPDGKIEIGLPIPAEYENSIIHIVHVEEDGTVEVYDTRRSNRVAYAKVDHLSVFSIAAPVEYQDEKEAFPWLMAIYGAAVLLILIGIWLIYRARKNEREDEE